ncbi:MAG TPA: ring-cleaving dioxygenase [Bryobacteraceae bacterium]|nr:ring-cleaving dioxygenase [Bryobacteraceae bacterium]
MLPGLHHVTAIASDPQANIDFCTGFLGLRLVKKTVNFDDPGTYHLYYGDETGKPGTILTFFPWPGARRGRRGAGEITLISFAVPSGSLSFWMERCRAYGIPFDGPHARFDEEGLVISDPDGSQMELVADAGVDGTPAWPDSPVPAAHAIRKFHSVTLSIEGYALTAELLTGTLGFAPVRESGNRFRFAEGDGGTGAIVDLLCVPAMPRGVQGAGTVHHVAWRTPDSDSQKIWREKLADAGLNVTPVIDRQYFHSIYFREPGGVLFEIAIDPPGFMIDESVQELGHSLKLPPWLEAARASLEQFLPPLRLRQTAAGKRG